jgi:hypothetical protein
MSKRAPSDTAPAHDVEQRAMLRFKGLLLGLLALALFLGYIAWIAWST